jgi:flagellar hook-associated protein 1 FlgK
MDNGATTVYIGSLAIVEGSDSFKIGTRTVKSGEISIQEVVWENTDRTIKSYKGQLKALMETRDELIPKYTNALDTMVESLVTSVNDIHMGGYGLDGSTGTVFFDPAGVTADSIRVDVNIDLNPDRIAASQSGEIGDNTNALAIADLRDTLLMNNGTATISDYYQDIIGDIGIRTNQAISQKENYELLVAQVENSRQSVQGVSLDEEMTQMIKYQNAFDAAARVITAMDQALDTVIHGMGITGI